MQSQRKLGKVWYSQENAATIIQVKSHWKNPVEGWSVIFERCRKIATRLSSEVKHLQGEKSNRA